MKTLILIAVVLGISGCTSFHVRQTDGAGANQRTTDLTATALFSSAQSFDKLKAFQSDKTQSFGSSGFEQQGATNIVAMLQALSNLLGMMAQAAAKP